MWHSEHRLEFRRRARPSPYAIHCLLRGVVGGTLFRLPHRDAKRRNLAFYRPHRAAEVGEWVCPILMRPRIKCIRYLSLWF